MPYRPPGAPAVGFLWQARSAARAANALTSALNNVRDGSRGPRFLGDAGDWCCRIRVKRAILVTVGWAILVKDVAANSRRGMAMESTIDGRIIRIDVAQDSAEHVLGRVRETLSRNAHFARHWREISCHFEDGVLTLRGCVPSFYLKQVLQAALMDVPGVERLDNQVDVVSSAGLSSVRPR